MRKSRCKSRLQSKNRGRKFRLLQEQLEHRRVLATVTLNTDTGIAGELRTELANAAPGETIDFNLPAGSETILLASGELVIDKPVTIDGLNSAGSGTEVTIDAGGASRVLNVNDGDDLALSSVNLSNLTITGGSSAADGGGIFNAEDLSLADAMVTGNVSADDGGGIASNGNLTLLRVAVDGNSAEDRAAGILAYGANSISESSISGNSIDTPTGDALGVGALFGAGSTTTIDSSQVNGNIGNTTYVDPDTMAEAAGRGAGIYVSGFADGIPTSLTITNSTLDSNETDGMGAGIQSGIAVTLLIEDSTISNNIAAGDAGAIGSSAFGNLAGATTTIRNSMLTGNFAGDDAGAIEGAGGITMIIEDSTIDDNYAYDRGGGIYINGTAGVIDSTLTITGSTFSNNRATDDGGGVHVGSATTFTMDDTDVFGNRVESGGVNTNHGGGVRVAFGTTSPSSGVITNSRITNNFAESDGGGLYAGSAFELTIEDTLFEGNSAGDDAGGLTLRTDTVVTITGATVINNVAADNSGGIYVLNGSSTSVTESSISGNTAADFGGGAWVTGGATATFERSTLANNEATSGGGGGADVTAAGVEFINSTISGNTTGGVGGGLYLELDPADPVMYSQSLMGTTLFNNNADGEGGGIYAGYYSAPSISGSIVSGNSSSVFAPDVYSQTTNVNPTFSLIGTNAGSLLVESPLDANGNIIGGSTGGVVDAMLGPLQDNGGPTMTHLPLAGSPVIDAGDPVVADGTDQIGNARVWDGGANMPGGIVDMGSVEYLSQPDSTFICDLNGDGVCDCEDIDSLQTEIVAGTDPPAFDFNADGVVDVNDRNLWFMDAAAFNGFSTPYQSADFNLDRVVDVSDFNIWNQNKFSTSAEFCAGDSNVDGVIDVSDFNIWNTQKFQSADTAGRWVQPRVPMTEQLPSERSEELEVDDSDYDALDSAFEQDGLRSPSAAGSIVATLVLSTTEVNSNLSEELEDSEGTRLVPFVFEQLQLEHENEESTDAKLRISPTASENVFEFHESFS